MHDKHIQGMVSRALCCLLLLFLLVSCSSVNNSAETALVTTTATSSPARVLQPRVDGGDESLLARQLARVQRIMAGMTLDQKLGQLLIVEYR